MKKFKNNLLALLFATSIISCSAQIKTNEDQNFKSSDDLKITMTEVTYDSELEHFIFDIKVKGKAGNSVPQAVGGLNGAYAVVNWYVVNAIKNSKGDSHN